MAKRRRSRAETQQQTREALLRSASKVFAQRGYHAATVDEVAATAGYSQGALYSNFAGKEALLLATARRYVEEQAQRWAQAFGDAPDEDSRLRAPADAWMDGLTQDPDDFLLFIELWTSAARKPALRPAFAEGWAAGREFMARAVRTVAEDGGLTLTDDQVDDGVTLLDALGIGLAVRRLVDPHSAPDDFFGRAVNDWLPLLLARWSSENG